MKLYLFNVREYLLSCMYACVPCVCLVPEEGYRSPGDGIAATAVWVLEIEPATEDAPEIPSLCLCLFLTIAITDVVHHARFSFHDVGDKTGISCMPGDCSTTELHPSRGGQSRPSSTLQRRKPRLSEKQPLSRCCPVCGGMDSLRVCWLMPAIPAFGRLWCNELRGLPGLHKKQADGVCVCVTESSLAIQVSQDIELQRACFRFVLKVRDWSAQ